MRELAHAAEVVAALWTATILRFAVEVIHDEWKRTNPLVEVTILLGQVVRETEWLVLNVLGGIDD